MNILCTYGYQTTAESKYIHIKSVSNIFFILLNFHTIIISVDEFHTTYIHFVYKKTFLHIFLLFLSSNNTLLIDKTDINNW